MINSSSPDATSSNPSGDLPSKQSGGSILPHAWGGAESAGRLPQYSTLQTAPTLLQRLRTELAKPGIVWFLGIHVLLGLTFYFAPEIDLGVSSLFYTPARGFILGSRSSTIVLPFTVGHDCFCQLVTPAAHW
jgi:hypothetical protein